MLSFLRASFELMDEVKICINSNAYLYRDIVDPKTFTEIQVDQAWIEKNYLLREFYLARENGNYVGVISYQNLGKFVYIGYLFVKDSHHNKGYGSFLIKFIETRAKIDHISILRLFCNPKYLPALNFYKKMGFSILESKKEKILSLDNGIIEPYYNEGQLYLQKVLLPFKLPQFINNNSSE